MAPVICLWLVWIKTAWSMAGFLGVETPVLRRDWNRSKSARIRMALAWQFHNRCRVGQARIKMRLGSCVTPGGLRKECCPPDIFIQVKCHSDLAG
jgi:hypothetical protein